MLPITRPGNHNAGQLNHSGAAPTLNCGQMQNAESRKGFIYKMKLLCPQNENIVQKIIANERLLRIIDCKSLLKNRVDLFLRKAVNSSRSFPKASKQHAPTKSIGVLQTFFMYSMDIPDSMENIKLQVQSLPTRSSKRSRFHESTFQAAIKGNGYPTEPTVGRYSRFKTIHQQRHLSASGLQSSLI